MVCKIISYKVMKVLALFILTTCTVIFPILTSENESKRGQISNEEFALSVNKGRRKHTLLDVGVFVFVTS